MIRTIDGRPALSSLGFLLLIFILVAGAAVVPLLNLRPSEFLLAQTLLQDLSGVRPAGARLFHSPSSDTRDTEYQSRLAKAQLAVLSMPESVTRQKVQSLIHIGTGNWQKAADILGNLAASKPKDPEILNDLGVVYLALGEHNAIYHFKALQLFETAKELAPAARAPRFNAILGYRIAGLEELERDAWPEYEQFEKDAQWIRELTPRTAPLEAELIEKLRRALERHKESGAEKLFDENAETYRHIATDYALNPADPENIDPVVRFIVSELQNRYHDETIPAILAPLTTKYRDRIIEARKFVRAGAETYLQSKLSESLVAYDRARAALTGVDGGFDELWIDLNRADTEARMGNARAARQLLDTVIDRSKQNGFTWLLGQALGAKGSNLTLTGNYADHLNTLEESTEVLQHTAASRDAVRPLYYLAMAHLIGGDVEGSLQFAHQALRLVRADDPVRRIQLSWLMGLLLQRMEFPAYATAFQKQSVAEAYKTPNPQVLVIGLSYLALIHEAHHEYEPARRYMAEIKDVSDKTEVAREKQLIDLNLNLLCSRIELGSGNLAEAERCLEKNIEILRSQPITIPYFYSPSLLQMAKVHSLIRRPDLAREEFRKAIEVIEENDDYFANAQTRLSFENERRVLYDSAIAFEYDQGRPDSAWSYTQRYRSKLFLEFMGQINPAVAQIRSEATERDKAQKLIPKDVQVVEYVLLPDKLLIWVVSGKVFTSKLVPVTRAALEGQVNTFLDGIRKEQNVTGRSQELYRLLIAPIEELLDPARTVAIIPDLDLHRLPFAALQNPAKSDYLIARYTVMESPNLTHLLAAPHEIPRRDSFVGFGARTDEAASARELAALGKIYPNVKSFSGDDANKAAFLAAMRNVAVFHYAGHSRDAADPLQSSILLDGSRDGPNSVTGLDVSRERMKRNAVVVLASCDSSVGNSRDGVGIRGLTSAFLISGAGSVVGSLWPVEAAGTSSLIAHFHEAFATGRKPVAQALRQAQLGFMKSFPKKSHPYYWSGFVVTGNTTALR